MKKIIALIPMLMMCIISFAAGPNMNGYSFKDTKTGEVFDFYSDKVIYKAPGTAPSRWGEYSFGNSAGLRQPVGGNKSVKITIQVYVGDRSVTLTGFVTYDPSTGKPTSLYLGGRYLTKYIGD